MPKGQIDPARLEGEELRRWYSRTPEEMERERQVAAARRYAEFFGPSVSDADAGFGRGIGGGQDDVDRRFSREPKESAREVDPALAWTSVSPGRWRGERGPMGSFQFDDLPGEPTFGDAVLDYGRAGPTDGGKYIEIGSKTRQHRRGWERREGKPWPTTEESRNFDAHHKVPKAYGGPDTLDNIEPKHPVPHRQDHMDEGDFREWGSWSRKGKGGGGAAPRGGPKVRGFGLLGIIPNFTGLLSGRIRTDTFDNFTSDMLGMPSQEDQRKAFEDYQRMVDPKRRAFEDYQRMLNPKWKPGDPIEV